MNIERTQQVSPILSAERISSNHAVAAIKLGNNQIKAEGEAALKLLDSVPTPTATQGNTINIRV